MFKGPFTILVSSKAERIDVEKLPQNERDILTHGVKYSSAEHNAFRFFIMPKIEMLDEVPARATKNVSFEQVNRVLVQATVYDDSVQFIGMYPTTLAANGQWELDMTAEAVFRPIVPGVLGLKLSGIAKNLMRQKSRPMIKAHRHNYMAQWLFFQPWIEAGNEFRIQILCVMEKLSVPKNRHVICDAKFADEGRVLAKVESHKVVLPA